MLGIVSRKQCRKCGESKSKDQFNKNAFTVDGLRPECKQCQSEYSRKKYQENREAILEQHRTWKANNQDRVIVIGKIWAKLNPRSPEKNSEYCNARRARKKNAGGRYTAEEWKQLQDSYGNICLCCKRSDVNLTPDHVVPLVKGGSNSIDNIQPLCLSCNHKKRSKIIDYRVQ